MTLIQGDERWGMGGHTAGAVPESLGLLLNRFRLSGTYDQS